MTERTPERMAGLGKGLAVIELFGQRLKRVTVSEAAEGTGLSPAAARRCLLTLTELGYLAHETQYFRPTPRLLRLGSSYLDTSSLPVSAQPYLDEVRDTLEESASLAVLDDGQALFVARAEASHVVSTGVRVGAELPAYCSATGWVLLAGLSDEQIAEYSEDLPMEKRTDRTLCDTSSLLRKIEQVRSEKVAYTDEEVALGMRSMAVPVENNLGATVAALSLSLFTGRASLERMATEFYPVVRGAAERLGKTL